MRKLKIRLYILLFLLSLTVDGLAQTADSLIVRDMRKAGVTFSHDNSIVLLCPGQEKYDEMFRAIRQAKSSVHLEYFNFRNDSIAFALFDILAEKAKEGVEVRALYDAFGNMSNNRPLKKAHVTALRQRGIDIHEFDPTRFPWFNHVFSRDHRKIVVIDGQIAFTGGMNVADYYIHGTDVVGPWWDMHCRIDGDEVNTLQRIFLRAWYKTTGEQIHGSKYFRGCSSMIEDSRFMDSGHNIISPRAYFKGLKTDTTATAYRKMVGVANREPYVTNRIMRQFYISCLDNAKDSVRIINPYISLTHSVKRAIYRCLKRGVKFQIMMSAVSDIPMEPDVSFLNLHRMMKRGAEVFVYGFPSLHKAKGQLYSDEVDFTKRPSGFHHTKIIMVDGLVCTVGSCNLDARSLNYDREENLIIVDKNTTAELNRHFDRQLPHCFLLTEESWKKWRKPGQRCLSWWESLISTWL